MAVAANTRVSIANMNAWMSPTKSSSPRNGTNPTNGIRNAIAISSTSPANMLPNNRKVKLTAHSTPTVLYMKGRPPQLFFSNTGDGISSLNPRTGEIIFRADILASRCVGSPVIAGKLVIGSSGFTTGIKNVVAIYPDRAGSDEMAKEIYRVDKSVPHIPTPLVFDGRLFLWSDIGVLSCLDAKTGKQHWQGRVGGNYFGSPVCVAGRLYCIDQDGVVVVVDATAARLEVLARNELGEASSATPAVSDGRMYLRTRSRLYSLGGKKQEPKK